MERFLVASAQDDEAVKLVDACMDRIGEIPADANLGFLYMTDQLAGDAGRVLGRLEERAPHLSWSGTVGLGICTSGTEIYDRAALSMMIGGFPEGSFRILPDYKGESAPLSPQLAHWWGAQEYCFALLHGDPSNPLTPAWLESLAQEQSLSFINGGLTSSNGQNTQLANRIVAGGISGVLFNDQVAIATDHTQGCSPIGRVHQITSARQNIAITLDNRPALDVMKADIGEVLSKEIHRIGGYVFAALPIAGSDTGDYLVRNLVGIDPDQGLVAIGDLLQGQRQMLFCRRDGNTARDDMEKMLQRLERRLNGSTIRGGIYISCLGRGRHQFGHDSEELRLIQRILGDFPLVGFFANGEIYNGRLYGYTGVLTLFL